MPQAVVHVLLTIIALDLIRDYAVRKRNLIPLHYLFVGGIAGLIPDADIPVYWLVKNVLGYEVGWFHRTITHSLMFPAAMLLITLIAVLLFRDKKRWLFFAVLTFGFSMHLLLDGLLTGYIPLFYPFSDVRYGLNLLGNIGWPAIVEGLEAVILLVWLYDLDRRHRLRDYW
ncbi:metal-dependent hydrolase [Candidatus Woesearchaeota archaeon]|nr:metal-dependent hydrolase [Candidatus Woesearchaeota archaeon]